MDTPSWPTTSLPPWWRWCSRSHPASICLLPSARVRPRGTPSGRWRRWGRRRRHWTCSATLPRRWATSYPKPCACRRGSSRMSRWTGSSASWPASGGSFTRGRSASRSRPRRRPRPRPRSFGGRRIGRSRGSPAQAVRGARARRAAASSSRAAFAPCASRSAPSAMRRINSG